MSEKLLYLLFVLVFVVAIVESQDLAAKQVAIDPVANLTTDALFVDEMPWLQFPPSRCGAIKFKWTNWCLNADDWSWTNIYPIRIKYRDCKAAPSCPTSKCQIEFTADADARNVSYPIAIPNRPRCVPIGYYKVNALKFDCNQDVWKKVSCLIPYRCGCICLYDNLDVARDY